MRIALLSLVIAFAMPVVSAAQSATDVAEGRKLFSGLCVTCHGFDGAGGAGPPLNRPRLLSPPTMRRCATSSRKGFPTAACRESVASPMMRCVNSCHTCGRLERLHAPLCAATLHAAGSCTPSSDAPAVIS